MKKCKTVLILNPQANGGQGIKKWRAMEQDVMSVLEDHTDEILTMKVTDKNDSISDLIKAGYNVFIAVGGDGTVNYLLNELMQHGSNDAILGAIGIGSSNDFHKPVGTMIQKVPVKINPGNAEMQDVGRVDFTDETGSSRSRYFIINSSIGVTAEANWRFNQNDFFLKVTKSKFTGLVILYAAMRTIFTYQNISIEMHGDGINYVGKVANVAVLKNPHVSGAFVYDQEIKIDDGHLGLSYCKDLSRFQLLKVLWDLRKRKFSGGDGRATAFIQHLSIKTDRPVPLEADGEVWMATDITYSIMPSVLKVIQF